MPRRHVRPPFVLAAVCVLSVLVAWGCDDDGSRPDDLDITGASDGSVGPDATPDFGGSPERCDNGVDDDRDGAIDCADADCACGPELDCTNGLDDDGDGFVDCEDFDCDFSDRCQEDCDNGIDDDGDGWIDCQDFLCEGAPECPPEICGNGFDDDGNGFADCDDVQCANAPGCAGERCDNGIDDDGNGFVDCDDLACTGQPPCVECAPGEFACGDGRCLPGAAECNGWPECESAQDEAPLNSCPCQADGTLALDPTVCCNGDPDGNQACGDQAGACGGPATDCLGTTPCCAGACTSLGICCIGAGFYYAAYEELPAEICCDGDADGDGWCGRVAGEVCDNGTDDDGDGAVDCNDADCIAAPGCSFVEVCDNGTDDDADGDVDCDDADCAANPGCAVVDEDCGNGVDDDADGDVDCADTDCAGAPECAPVAEDCDNGIDDDGDNQVDCMDFECFSHPACQPGEGRCADGADGDGDGAADCADSDCTGTAVCGNTCADPMAFVCDDGACLPAAATCNGYRDCMEGEDESQSALGCACLPDGSENFTGLDRCCNGDPDGNFVCGTQASACEPPGFECDRMAQNCCRGPSDCVEGSALGVAAFCCAPAGVVYQPYGLPDSICCNFDYDNDGVCD